MKNFKLKKEFKSDRPFKSNRPFRKDFDRPDSRPRFNADRSVRRFDREGDKPHRSSRTLEMFDVTCSRCGKECQVPFKPMTSKPVYCRDCFKKNDSQDGSEPRSFEPRSFESRSFEPRRFEPRTEEPSDELQKINRKLDRIMKALKII